MQKMYRILFNNKGFEQKLVHFFMVQLQRLLIHVFENEIQNRSYMQGDFLFVYLGSIL